MPLEKSTTVQSAEASQRIWRSSFSLLSHIAPGVAALAASTLFMRPRRFQRPDRERAVLREATPIAFRFGRRRLAGYRWGEGPAVILVHGWEGRASQLGTFVPPLVRRGYSVVGFDAWAHGASEGRSGTLFDFADAVWAVARQSGPLHGIVAHSMGAAATGLALAEGLALPRAVFVAPPADMVAVTRRFAGFIGVSDDVRARMQSMLERRFDASFESLNVGSVTPPARTRLLVVHDRDDIEVPYREGAHLASSWPGAAIHTTHGLGHRRVLRDPAVVDATAAFLSDPPATIEAPEAP